MAPRKKREIQKARGESGIERGAKEARWVRRFWKESERALQRTAAIMSREKYGL